ncbi:uncharacterized protein LOC119839204 isoform X2 [Zerene cesonia]|uniref:uncharacterized protein LOC119839204 isoform X2 n=1 Tax=Zerene cesonia TaxID=33412 RepID=UPI0018E569DD|nr:uncharacterized protein LOC119839204 isoform X2 [Zerene cesonia]
MKIPETSNVGAYYGNEENGQWQPNGVIIDNGVGGGVVGSGDAGVHRPPVYPVHMPRGPMPGYVMAGAYYPAAYPAAAAPQDDFADYMWMENEEEFDKQVMQQLEEEALMEQCIEAMLEDEQRERHRPVTNGHNNFATTSNGTNSVSLQEAVSRSTLNPLAAEFVPSRARQPPEEKQDPPETKEDSDKPKEDIQPSSEAESQEKIEVTEVKKEESSPQTETPEVSAADVQPIDETDAKSKEKPKQGKTETKKPARAADAKPKPRREAKAKSAPCDQQSNLAAAI